MKFLLYQAPEIKAVCSMPITLIDGTSSMNREYKYIIQAYEQTFGDLLEIQRMQFQWSWDLTSLQPYLNSERGNLTTTLDQLFSQMLFTEFPTYYVTIILVTDGREPLDINSLMDQCLKVKSKFFIQLLCIAFGNQFPISNFQNLKQIIENQNLNYQSFFQIERSEYHSFIKIKNDLNLAFKKIREQLVYKLNYHDLRFEVFTSFSLLQPKKQLQSNELFLVQADQENVKIEEQFTKINSPNLVLKFLRQSLQKCLLDAKKQQSYDIIIELNQICKSCHEFIISLEQIEANSQQMELINLILQVIENIKFDPNQKDSEIQQIIEQYESIIMSDDPQNFRDLLDSTKILTFEELVNKTDLEMKQKFKILLIQISQNGKNLPDESFTQFRKTIIYCNNSIFQCFESIQPINSEKQISQFQILVKSFIQSSQEVFQNENFNINTMDQFKQLIDINQQFINLNQLTTEANQNKLQTIINNLKVIDLPIDPYYQFNDILQLGKTRTEQISDKYLIFLYEIDENLKIYTDSILKCYHEVFQNIPPKKRLEIKGLDKNLVISSNYEYERSQFNTFKELLDFVNKKVQLKKKQIQLVILMDNEESYNSLHLSLRLAYLSNYKFNLIYIPVGIKIQTYLEQQIANITESFQNTKQLIKCIPKQINSQEQKNISDQQRNNYLKILQDIARYIDIMNF